MLVDDGARGFRGDAQGGRELAIVDLVVLRAEHRASELAGEVRLAPSRLRRRNPVQWQPELVLEHEVMIQPRLVVGRQGDDQRPLGPQFHVNAGRPLQFRGESGPTRLALAAQRDQRFLAGLGLRAGGEHPSGGVACASASRALVEYLDRRPLSRQPPGDAQPDHPGADDGDVGLCNIG